MRRRPARDPPWARRGSGSWSTSRTNSKGRRRSMFRLVTVLLLAAALLMSPAAARADDPPYVGWSQLLPGPDDRVQPLERERLRGRSDPLRGRRHPRDAATLRSAGASPVITTASSRSPTCARPRSTVARSRIRRSSRTPRSSTTRTPSSPASTSTPTTPGTRGAPATSHRPGRSRSEPRDDHAMSAAGQPLVGHQRAHPARPAVRARRLSGS